LRRLRRLPRLRGGRALWRRVRGGRALWRPMRGGSALRMCALRRLALCPLRLQLLGLRGTLLDMGVSGLDIHLLTRQRGSSRKSTREAACPIASRPEQAVLI
jgi:hypothetical protein